MPKLTENVLIGGRVRLAGEDVSEADAVGVRPEVFEPAPAPPARLSLPGRVRVSLSDRGWGNGRLGYP